MTEPSQDIPFRDEPWPLPECGECRFLPLAPDTEAAWETFLAARDAYPVGYHPLHLAYQHEYFAGVAARYRRLDSLIVLRGEVVGIWPLASDGAGNLSSHINGAAGIAPPLLAEQLSDKQRKQAVAACLTALAHLARSDTDASRPWRFAGVEASASVDAWQQALLSRGASSGCRYRLVADLSLDAASYHRQLRKSYKSLINSAEKQWSARIDATGDAAEFARFAALHEQVAGRKTRSAATWRWQYEAIACRQAFAVYLRDTAGEVVGASLFNASRDEAYYAVGAYDRRLFDQPVAHLSLHRAICHARDTGRRRLILGDRPFPGDQPAPNAKELQIAFFKEGFATDLQILPVLTLPIAALLSSEPSAR